MDRGCECGLRKVAVVATTGEALRRLVGYAGKKEREGMEFLNDEPLCELDVFSCFFAGRAKLAPPTIGTSHDHCP